MLTIFDEFKNTTLSMIYLLSIFENIYPKKNGKVRIYMFVYVYHNMNYYY